MSYDFKFWPLLSEALHPHLGPELSLGLPAPIPGVRYRWTGGASVRESRADVARPGQSWTANGGDGVPG